MEAFLAIIGCGRIGTRHAEQVKKTGKLLAVCDIIEERAASLAAFYGVNYYLSAEEMLANEPGLTIAAVCTPNGLHAKHSILCLDAGLHVLCEKPLAITVADGQKMIAAALRNNKKLLVVKQNRYNPPVIALKDLLVNGTLGKIFSFQVNCFWNRPPEYYQDSWKGSKKMDGGTLFTQFSHFIDLLYWLLGDVKEVKAIVSNFGHPMIEIDDSGVVLFDMLSGATGTMNYTVNSFQQNMEGSFSVFGEKGTVKIGGQYLNELEYQCIKDREKIILTQGNTANNYGFYRGSMSNHDKIYENLMNAIYVPGHDFASAEDGLKTIDIIEKIYRAAALR